MNARAQIDGWDRALAGLLIAAMVVGGFALWIAVPIAILWSLGQLVDSAPQHLMLALIAVPAAMVLFGALLSRLNLIYLQVSGYATESDEELWRPRLQGPLDRILGVCAIIALVAMLAWMTFGEAPTIVHGPW